MTTLGQKQARAGGVKDTPFQPVRFTVDDYSRMAEAGILHEDSRVELIEGSVIAMSPIGVRHAACVAEISALMHSSLGPAAIIYTQNPLRLGELSEPQPDVAVLRPRPDRYRTAHPGPEDVFLLFEVMDSSVGFDHDVKLPLYARAGVPEVWLVDLNRELVEVYRRPVEGVYTESRVLARGESLAPEALPGLVIAAEAVLG